jgi:MerR-like DNA binding protein
VSQAQLRSGQLAEAAGVNLQTVRYYERRGLLAKPERSLGGHRLYPAETVTVLKVIRRRSGSDSLSRRSLTCSKPGAISTADQMLAFRRARRPSSPRSRRRSPI